MSQKSQHLTLARPSFWSEFRSPETWLMALVALDGEQKQNESLSFGGPYALWGQKLSGTLSKRSVSGLYGAERASKQPRLLGVGFLTQTSQSTEWTLTSKARELAAQYREKQHQDVLVSLIQHLLNWSPWLRILLLRLLRGDWELVGWSSLRGNNGPLLANKHLVFHTNNKPSQWFAELHQKALGAWHATLERPPQTLTIEKRKHDAFSWTPLKGPLYLLDSMGWLSSEGKVQIPFEVATSSGLQGQESAFLQAHQLLSQLTKEQADIRGFVSVEAVMHKFLSQQMNGEVNEQGFFRWMDQLLTQAIGAGAIELLEAEAGQARHGRGLGGDRSKKLVRWIVHPEFNTHFAQAMGLFDDKGQMPKEPNQRASRGGESE